MFVIEVWYRKGKEQRCYYAKREDGMWYRWYRGDSRENWVTVPWCGF
jgi:hypothetical protein